MSDVLNLDPSKNWANSCPNVKCPYFSGTGHTLVIYVNPVIQIPRTDDKVFKVLRP